MTEELRRFALVGESSGSSSSAVKHVSVLASAPTSSLPELTLSLHVVPGTKAAVAAVSARERSRGALLLDKPKHFHFYDSGNNLCLQLEDFAKDWEAKNAFQVSYHSSADFIAYKLKPLIF